ncbi:hypothetical protein R6Q59_001677 [Mikania micrantha]
MGSFRTCTESGDVISGGPSLQKCYSGTLATIVDVAAIFLPDCHFCSAFRCESKEIELGLQGCGHGGDGTEDPPPSGGFGRGYHEANFASPRKTRGKAKTNKLTHAMSQSGGPLTIPFDVNATYTPIGELNDWFTREVEIYMWEHIAFDKSSRKYVSPVENNALYEHLKHSFDLDEIKRDHESAYKKGGIEAELLKRYRDRKAYTKQHFIKCGGYDDEERNDLKAEFQNQIGSNSDGEFEESSSSHLDEVVDQIESLFQDPKFMDQLSQFFASQNKKPYANGEDDSDEGDE